jgi:hypothetical protein
MATPEVGTLPPVLESDAQEPGNALIRQATGRRQGAPWPTSGRDRRSNPKAMES